MASLTVRMLGRYTHEVRPDGRPLIVRRAIDVDTGAEITLAASRRSMRKQLAACRPAQTVTVVGMRRLSVVDVLRLEAA